MSTTARLLFWISVPTVLSVACQASHPDTAARVASASNQSPLTVATARVSRGSGAVAEAPARIRSRQGAVISSRISALVLSVPFREGDIVRKGETLVRLDDAPQRAVVTAAEVQLSTAESESRRITSLLEKGAATVREADEVKARLAGARSALASARDWQASTSLQAPFAGRVTSKSVNPGDLAKPGAPLLELQGGSALELVATLEPGEARSIRVGQRLKVRVDGTDHSLDAVVYSIAPVADDTTHRVDVLFNLGPAVFLKPGLFARVDLPAPQGPDSASLRVPKSAVLRRGGLTGVFVVEEGRAWLRWIALGRELDGQVDVRAGLREGERVALAPAGLTDGMGVVVAGEER